MRSWFKARLGRMRVSTIVLIVAFLALFWVYHNFEPRPPTEAPTTAVVPPGFVPDPNYTWVPRTDVRRPKEPETTTPTTTSPTEATTSPGETTSPTSPTTVVPGPLGPQTITLTPTLTPTTPTTPASGPAPTTPAPPS
ncbi:MAG TPA: hypothetical protein VER34_20300 [Mycobacterium sp.]|jgi:hypothetical protein|nr:hypothetical protein [Mycobacterium sp.]